MRKLLLFLALTVPLFAQYTRVDPTPVFTTRGNVAPPALPTLLGVPYAQISVCAFPANGVPCTNYATTYSGPAGSACPSNQQVVLQGTNSCGGTTDALGNFGFWVAPGATYTYTVTSRGTTAGPFYFTVGSASTGGVTTPAFTGVAYATTSSPTLTSASASQIKAQLGTVAANQFLAGPTSGSPAASDFRSIGNSDIATPVASIVNGLGVAFTATANVFTNLNDFGAGALAIPSNGGVSDTAARHLQYNSVFTTLELGIGGGSPYSDRFPYIPSSFSVPTAGHCVAWGAFYQLTDTGAACGSGSGVTLSSPNQSVAIGSSGPGNYTLDVQTGPTGGMACGTGAVGPYCDIVPAVVTLRANNYTGANKITGAWEFSQARASATTFATISAACSSTTEGMLLGITDSNTATWGATIAGGGTNHVLGYCDGTNLTVMGK